MIQTVKPNQTEERGGRQEKNEQTRKKKERKKERKKRERENMKRKKSCSVALINEEKHT